VLAVAIPAHDAKRRALGVDDHDGVHPVGFACPAEILDGLAGSVRTRGPHCDAMIAQS
jgi:hypothetical protein